ncbi:hypothetical protein KRR38_26495 [Novosphingobium sp. G106]|uniref:hypothetical protein n=1 Tax=Novosphingobium sp. G106 TaxID=2849500 RepID=UPI001C2D04E0|nr:hypothetical protein [Novosphingobium sp. G106]MBV1691133.1 hypothetical protein [Novosphingobium sp. G106]
MRVVAALAIVLALSACGVRRDLKPQAGKSLPPAPYGREEPRGASALLEPLPQAAPERTVELRQRSEERADDPFDLPPSD